MFITKSNNCIHGIIQQMKNKHDVLSQIVIPINQKRNQYPKKETMQRHKNKQKKTNTTLNITQYIIPNNL